MKEDNENIEWFKERCGQAGLEQPSQKASAKFVDRARSMRRDKMNNQSIGIIRRFIFSVYIWGGLGKIPKIK